MSTITHVTELADGKSLMSDTLFDRLVARIRAEHPELAPDMPARILDQALAFLGACAVTTTPIGPSELVDIGWHTFILYTREYAAFCEQIAGRFIHHVPDDATETTQSPERGGLKATVTAIRATGYRIDPALWSIDSVADCSQCYNGCSDTPNR
jgi:hypothetical protein